MKVYLASPFFNDKEKLAIIVTMSILKSKGLDMFVPNLHFIKDGDKLSNQDWGKAVFQMDANEICACDAVVLLYYGLYSDSGTAWECGYAYANCIPVIVVNMQENEIGSIMMLNGCHASLDSLYDLEEYDFNTMPQVMSSTEQKQSSFSFFILVG